MSNEQPAGGQSKPAGDSPADAQVDPLAAELMAMGSFGDVGGSASAQPANSSQAAESVTPPAAASRSPAMSQAASAGSGVPDLSELEQLLKAATFDDAGTTAANLQDDLADELLAQAAAAANETRAGRPMPTTSNFDLPAFQQAISDAQASSIDLLRDVDLNVKIELGRSRMMVEDVLKLTEGSVVELDKLAGDPVDVFVNDKLVARGEVLVLNDNFCVRVNEIVASVKELS